MKVVNGTDRCNRKVKIYRNGDWEQVCNTDWTRIEENVMCGEMNCGMAAIGKWDVHFGETFFSGGFKVACAGNETFIGQCTATYITENYMEASVVCPSKLQFNLPNIFEHDSNLLASLTICQGHVVVVERVVEGGVPNAKSNKKCFTLQTKNRFGFKMGTVVALAEWKFSTIGAGELFAITNGTWRTQPSFVGS